MPRLSVEIFIKKLIRLARKILILAGGFEFQEYESRKSWPGKNMKTNQAIFPISLYDYGES